MLRTRLRRVGESEVQSDGRGRGVESASSSEREKGAAACGSRRALPEEPRARVHARRRASSASNVAFTSHVFRASSALQAQFDRLFRNQIQRRKKRVVRNGQYIARIWSYSKASSLRNQWRPKVAAPAFRNSALENAVVFLSKSFFFSSPLLRCFPARKPPSYMICHQQTARVSAKRSALSGSGVARYRRQRSTGARIT